MSNECIYIVDTFSLIFRAHYGNTHIRHGAALTVARMLLALIGKYKPTHLVCVFDHPTATFRHDLYNEYKANRIDMPDNLRTQMPIIKDIINALNIPIVELSGYEADDLIGTIVNKASAGNIASIIVSPDKDLLQLVDDTKKIQVLNNRDGEIWFNRDEVKKRHGVWPEQMVDLLTLAGDASDNIKGVSGIGDIGAKELINYYGSLDNIIARRFELKRKAYRDGLEKSLESLPKIKRLVTIVTNLELPLEVSELSYKGIDHDKARVVFKHCGFETLTKEFTKTGTINSISNNKKLYRMSRIEDLREAVRECRNHGLFSIDTETTAIDPTRGHLVGIALSWQSNTGLYIPIAHLKSDYIDSLADTLPGLYASPKLPNHLIDLKDNPISFFEELAPYLDPRNIPFSDVYNILNPLLMDPTVLKVGQNLKYDLQILKRHGLTLKGIKHDSMVLSFLINPESHHNLDDLSSRYLDYLPIPFEAIAGKGKEQKRFDEIDLHSATQYAAEDADIALQLCNKLEPLVCQSNTNALYHKVDLPLVEVLADMELRGICLDTHVLQNLAADMRIKRNEIEKHILELAGEPFNLNSPSQLGKILYEHLKLPILKRTPKTKAPATDESVLSKLSLRDDGEIAKLLLGHRQIQKLLSTYIEALPGMVNPITGRLHTKLHQTVTTTGRLTSSNPNLQNIPIRSNEGRAIRAAFIPEPGWVLLDADYSQIELRVVASLAQDPILLEAFKNGEDIHQRTASEVLSIPITSVSATQRNAAKAINFGLLYGQGAATLATNLNISIKEAKHFIERYFERMPNVAKWIELTKTQALQDCLVYSYWGRTRYIPNLHSVDQNLKATALREAVNTVVQGTAADIMRRAMVLIHQGFTAAKLQSKLILQIHDELLIESPKGEIDIASSIIKNAMEHADDILPLSVNLIVNINSGTSWLECK